ncbi:hypothetical protein ACOSP7_008051 [Xanthoceras sorbifolium]
MEVLQKLLQQPTQPSIGSGSLAQKGNYLTALNVRKENLSHHWIVDSGASDHMTGNRKLFHVFQPCSGNYTVRITDGSLSKVTGIGSIKISGQITLNSVLLVPNLDCNLLSISKFTKEQNSVAKFLPNCCVFQDSVSGMTIGSAKVCLGLYILEANYNQGRQNLAPPQIECVSFKS